MEDVAALCQAVLVDTSALAVLLLLVKVEVLDMDELRFVPFKGCSDRIHPASQLCFFYILMGVFEGVISWWPLVFRLVLLFRLVRVLGYRLMIFFCYCRLPLRFLLLLVLLFLVTVVAAATVALVTLVTVAVIAAAAFVAVR